MAAISGDQTVCKQVAGLVRPIETAIVKEAGGIYSATVMPPPRASA